MFKFIASEQNKINYGCRRGKKQCKFKKFNFRKKFKFGFRFVLSKWWKVWKMIEPLPKLRKYIKNIRL